MPWNTTAEILLPAVPENAEAQNVLPLPAAEGTRILLGAGQYTFVYKEPSDQ